MMNDSIIIWLKEYKTKSGPTFLSHWCVKKKKKSNLKYLGVHRLESLKGYILHIMSNNILTSVQKTKLV